MVGKVAYMHYNFDVGKCNIITDDQDYILTDKDKTG